MITARYDVVAKEIKGCKKGSLAYWHEYRHKLQDEKGFFTIQWVSVSNSIYLLIIFFIYLLNRELAFTCLFVSICTIVIAEEVDAWIYAIRKKVRKC